LKKPGNCFIYIIIIFITITVVSTNLTKESDSSDKESDVKKLILFNKESDVKKLKIDPFNLKQATLTDKDILTISVFYTGGCKKHDFALGTVPGFVSTNSTQHMNLVLAHRNNGDACKKIVTESLHFDISPLKEKHQEIQGQKSSRMILHLMNAALEYEFK
jgi:hypothetical protein